MSLKHLPAFALLAAVTLVAGQSAFAQASDQNPQERPSMAAPLVTAMQLDDFRTVFASDEASMLSLATTPMTDRTVLPLNGAWDIGVRTQQRRVAHPDRDIADNPYGRRRSLAFGDPALVEAETLSGANLRLTF